MQLRGYIDGIIGGDLVGWAVDQDEPARRLTVRAELDGRPLGARPASERRGDLRAAGIGDGSSGFRFVLDKELARGEHLVQVLVEGADQALDLANDWMALGKDDVPLRGVSLVVGAAPRPREPRGAGDEQPPARDTGPTDAPVRALIGASHWLFPCSDEGPASVVGVRRSFAEVDAAVSAVEELFTAAASIGAAVTVAGVPSKAEVYPELLPPGLEGARHERLRRLIEARLRDSDSASMVDLLSALVDARAHGRVFTRTGTGLTWIGAFHAYRAVVRSLAHQIPGLTPLALSEFDVGPLAPVADSLAQAPKVAWLDGGLVTLDGLRRVDPLDVEPALAQAPNSRAVDVSGRVGRGLIFHGRRGGRIAQLVAAHVLPSRVVEAERFDPELIDRERPGLIVWLMS